MLNRAQWLPGAVNYRLPNVRVTNVLLDNFAQHQIALLLESQAQSTVKCPKLVCHTQRSL